MEVDLSHIEAVIAVWLVVLGLVIGSFLNVVIARVPQDQSIVKPRSRCPSCGHQLVWYDNIPVVSWLLLRGRCRSCKTPISPRYVLVELLTGALFLACLSRFGWSWELVGGLVLVCLLVPLTFIDLEHWILPFALTRPGIGAGILLSIPLGWERVVQSAIGAAAGFLLFWGMEFVGRWVFKKEALGEGDKWLLAMLGAFLTWKALLPIIFLSSLQGAIVGSILLAVRGRAGPAAADQEPAQDDAAVSTAEPNIGSDSPPGMSVEATGETGSTARANDQSAGSEPAVEAPGETEPKADGGSAQMEEGPTAKSEEDEEDDWVPGPTNIPFGPWLAIAALEVMLLGPGLMELLPSSLSWVVDIGGR